MSEGRPPTASRAFLTYTPWEPLTLRADYTFLIAKDDILDQELLRRPKNKASLDASWHITEKAVLSATLLYVGPWVDVNRAGTVTGLTGKRLHSGKPRGFLRSG